MQDAFLLWERWDQIERIEDPTGYLFRVALNGFRMRADVRTLLLGLTPRQRAALLLVDLLGYPSEQAGGSVRSGSPARSRCHSADHTRKGRGIRKKLVATTVLVIALTAGGHAPVGAVNGDLDGNAHPNEGVMLVQDANGDIVEFCGGVLISPTVFLTNHNCPGALAFAQSIGGRAVVTFEPVLPWPPVGPAFRTVEAGYVHPDANPQKATDLYGISVLARPVRGVTPAQLPTLQQLASIGKGETLTVVGYGPNDRRFADVTVTKIDSGMITLLNSANATGQGGACGDGGSPYFLPGTDVVVGVADGETGHGQCNSISWAFRNDTETARSFFDDFVSVP